MSPLTAGDVVVVPTAIKLPIAIGANAMHPAVLEA
jgi:hypothetical protein